MADDEKSLTPTEDLREIGDDASVEKDAAGITAPAPDDLQRKLTFSRRLNVFLGVAAAFLLVIAIAQPLSQSNPPVNPAARETPAATTPETDDDSDVPSEASASADAAGPDRPALAIQLAKADPNDPMAFGDINAPLTVIEWTDYRCPFCAKFTNDTMPERAGG